MCIDCQKYMNETQTMLQRHLKKELVFHCQTFNVIEILLDVALKTNNSKPIHCIYLRIECIFL
jgi:hypothetical protein